MFLPCPPREQPLCQATAVSFCPRPKTVPRELFHNPLPEASSSISHVTLYFKYTCPSIDCLLCGAVELGTQQKHLETWEDGWNEREDLVEVSHEVAGASPRIDTPLRLRKELKEGFQNEHFQLPLNKNASFFV